MTTEFLDPEDEEDALPLPADAEYSEIGEDYINGEMADEVFEPVADPVADEPALGHRAEQLVSDDVLPTDVDGGTEDLLRAGNAALEAIGRQVRPTPANLPPILGPPADKARNLFLPRGRFEEDAVRTLPGSPEPDGVLLELDAMEQAASPQQSAEKPPVVVRHLAPQIAGSAKDPNPSGRERLRIEIEITLTNAERISRIAVEEAKAEFKKLASQATQRLDEKFYEYRANQRLLRRG